MKEPVNAIRVPPDEYRAWVEQELAQAERAIGAARGLLDWCGKSKVNEVENGQMVPGMLEPWLTAIESAAGQAKRVWPAVDTPLTELEKAMTIGRRDR